MAIGNSIFPGAGARPAAPPAAQAAPFQTGAPTQASGVPAEDPAVVHARLAARAFGGGAIERARPGFERGANDAVGYYLSRIDAMLLKESQNEGERGDLMVIVEKTVIFVLDSSVEHKPNRVGEKVGQVFKLRKSQAYGSFRLMVAKILDIPVDDVQEGAATWVTDPVAQPMAGTCVLHRNAFSPKPMKGKTAHFLNVNYERAVPAAELLADLSGAGIPEGPAKADQVAALKATKDKFFPNGMLERMAEVEKAQAAKA